MDINCWWEGDSEERYWLEITRRSDIGTNLKAPQRNEGGEEYWGYSLINYIRSGDHVFHYDKKKHAFVGCSRAYGEVWNDQVIWAARGGSARRLGIDPHLRSGWYLGLEDFTEVSPPLTLEEIRANEQLLRTVRDNLDKTVNGSLYSPFQLSDSRPPRPQQAYITKLPVGIVERFPRLRQTTRQLEAVREASGVPSSSLGTEYRTADEESSIDEIDPFSVDPGLRERGVRSHAETQNSLAAWVQNRNWKPRSPRPDEPDFDLAWRAETVVWVAEVKSLTEENEERQLRLGLGQVLRYRALLGSAHDNVRALLALERGPCDETWLGVCRSVHVTVAWQGAWQQVLG